MIVQRNGTYQVWISGLPRLVSAEMSLYLYVLGAEAIL